MKTAIHVLAVLILIFVLLALALALVPDRAAPPLMKIIDVTAWT